MSLTKVFQNYLEENKGHPKFPKCVAKSIEMWNLLKDFLSCDKITTIFLGHTLLSPYQHRVNQWTFEVATWTSLVDGYIDNTFIVNVTVNKYGYVAISKTPSPGLYIIPGEKKFPCDL